ncbi:hypothetical protein [Paracoccus aminophilus]|uniref:Uncharacterized protein n=1 Tax=Paracoccus aminophilus JCM 7686 TaxID=1367847 RepID=S5XT50_PARAH|nr:hypothetical protein [Paracoccus aminophilus]AGT08332.1 hypothetical protein JCM7686_1226 [Paracoccus aminophilus JCM 7686]
MHIPTVLSVRDLAMPEADAGLEPETLTARAIAILKDTSRNHASRVNAALRLLRKAGAA